MKKFLIAGAALVALTGAASAADLTYEPAPAAPAPAAASAFDWNGFYVGVHGGAAIGDFTKDFSDNGSTGGLFGAQAGYNYQIDHWVIGVETDIAYSTLSDVVDLDWLGTTTARAGYAFDNLLLYGKGGVAYGDLKYADQSNWSVGWTAGAGVEYGFTKNITGRLEYDYVSLPSKDFGGLETGLNTNNITVGLNYKF
ncbi:porin family protein [Kaistia dalseonensis]|uniref:Outer membrane immunogenic protein n=1 Tax=Kaistia dalseonensis TaxID=410840 RepID=A0ABU0H4U2_9HYPH|nr:outer membrane protein [Kaistia dalseonensis]MCX5494731.1 porin family protein [Kaistia dalseonensis]MDQ0437312.1 outer membrane immunogenic protein [Kaistia dalseonensis]